MDGDIGSHPAHLESCIGWSKKKPSYSAKKFLFNITLRSICEIDKPIPRNAESPSEFAATI